VLDYRRYSFQCWITFPEHWPENAGVPSDHPNCDQRIYWILEYCDSLEALRYFKNNIIFRQNAGWFKEKALTYVRWFIPGSCKNVCKEYHGTVAFAEGHDDDLTILHESLHMARHMVDHWFADRESKFWEERMAYVQEHCFFCCEERPGHSAEEARRRYDNLHQV